MKRIYGTLALVALVSGATGAVTFSFLHNRFSNLDNDPVVNGKVSDSQSNDDGFMTLASKDDTPKTHSYIDLTEAAEKGCNAVVYIKVTQNGSTRIQEYYDPFDDMFSQFFGRGNGGTQRRQIQTPKRQGAGSGVIISSDGYIVTNNHVVDGAKSINIQGINGDFNNKYSAEVISTDKVNDLAIIKVKGVNIQSNSIPYAVKTGTSEVGEEVFVLGYPLTSTMGEEIKLTTGVISSKTGFQGDVSIYQISAPIQPGNSGGPLFDSKGNVIGIVSAKHKGAENVGYAIKTSYLKNLMESAVATNILPQANKMAGQNLSGKVKMAKNYVYYITCSSRGFIDNNLSSSNNISTSKKTPNTRKTGYRIQVFTGDNSTKARKKAEEVKKDIEQLLLGTPVYVHFYNPNWICRVGNFLTVEDANIVLDQIKKHGYEDSKIVKGVISTN